MYTHVFMKSHVNTCTYVCALWLSMKPCVPVNVHATMHAYIYATLCVHVNMQWHVHTSMQLCVHTHAIYMQLCGYIHNTINAWTCELACIHTYLQLCMCIHATMYAQPCNHVSIHVTMTMYECVHP